ncbi:MAG: hypothetical protein LQ342_004197 [Letrouitia transgressa]|nr:MAG: hypothetical protein LQ342_004197 [Letrouitia transgressa]
MEEKTVPDETQNTPRGGREPSTDEKMDDNRRHEKIETKTRIEGDTTVHEAQTLVADQAFASKITSSPIIRTPEILVQDFPKTLT